MSKRKKIEIADLQPDTLVKVFQKSLSDIKKYSYGYIIMIVKVDVEKKEVKACETNDLFLYLLGDEAHRGLTFAYEKYEYEFYELTKKQKKIANTNLQMTIGNFDRRIINIGREMASLYKKKEFLEQLKEK
jgi:hypothetical protein